MLPPLVADRVFLRKVGAIDCRTELVEAVGESLAGLQDIASEGLKQFLRRRQRQSRTCLCLAGLQALVMFGDLVGQGVDEPGGELNDFNDVHCHSPMVRPLPPAADTV